MRIALLDDSAQDLQQLRDHFAQFARENNVDLQTVPFTNAAAFLREDPAQFSMVVMDIEMPGLNGVEAARRLRQQDESIALMFVTAMPQYAMAGYEVEAVDYVLKPVSYADFALKLRKALRYVDWNRERRIMLRTTEGVVLLPTSRPSVKFTSRRSSRASPMRKKAPWASCSA